MMKLWNEQITGVAFDRTKVLACIALALSNRKVEERANMALTLDEDYINKALMTASLNDIGKDKKKMAHRIKTKILSKAKVQYYQEFQKIHMNVKPMAWEEIVALCEQKGIDHSKLVYDKSSMMLLNACMAPDCPHFLKPNSKPLRDHLGGWQDKMPYGFHLFISNHLSLEDGEILKQFKAERKIDDDWGKYNTCDDIVLDYIKMVKAKYNKAE